MKKRLLATFVLLATFTVASAQTELKGKFGIGLDACGIIVGRPFNGGGSIKLQYNLTNNYRVEANASRFLADPPYKWNDYEDRSEPYASYGIDLHSTIGKYHHRTLQLYLITGISYTQLRHKEDHSYLYNDNWYKASFELNDNKWGANIGLGILLRVHRQINLNINGVFDTNIKGSIKAGITYIFN